MELVKSGLDQVANFVSLFCQILGLAVQFLNNNDNFGLVYINTINAAIEIHLW